MTRKNFLTLAGAAAVLLIAGLWVSAHKARQQADLGGGAVFDDLRPALGALAEIRLSKGDGSRTTLKREKDGWTVVERNYPADPARVRELALALAGLKVVERKTSDPANYAKLGVEPADSPTATSTLVELVAGKQTWDLIVGKAADGRAVYVRKPKDAASALAEPLVTVDPDQKRWVDRLVTDIPGTDVHEISVQPAAGSAYLLTRAKRGDADLVLSPVPKGRNSATSMALSSQGEALAGLNFDDVHALEGAPPAATDRATWKLFDGQVIELAGHRTGDKTFVTVAAHRDAALAAQFAAPDDAKADAKTDAKADAKAATPAKPDAQTVERLAGRTTGVQYEIPAYKYDALFKAQEDLLEKPPAPPVKAAKQK
ncbi:MAG TPA: DUF4340 domain-containing protein [Steroidobacteraceae bacterium]|nr:DUF4340 domain-containing protein [Steroidobacteraceae bacterium]